MTIRLSIPTLRGATTADVETRPKQVKEWLDALPMANSFEAARKLTDAIIVSRGAKLGEEARLKLLDQYRETVHVLLPSLEQDYAGKPLPLADRAKQAATLARGLLTELSHGYKLVVLELSQRRVALGAVKLTPLVVQRAIECLGGVLDVCYETYAPTPAGIWLELHQLYWFAVRQNVHEETFTEVDAKRSVNATYKRVLLTALADPYRLQQGQLGAVIAYLDGSADLAVLQSLGESETTHGLFVVRLDADKPPKALAQHSGVTDARTDILLNTIPFARQLHQQLQAVDEGQTPATAGLPAVAAEPVYREMLKRLLKLWGLGPKRVFSRVSADTTTYICAGIRSLHHALAGDTEQLPMNQAEMEEALEITVQMTTPADSTGQYSTFNCSNWHVLNESAGGVALSLDPQGVAKVRVGDLVGLGAGGGYPWGVAVVRWIQGDTPGKLQLGAQFLSPRAEAVALKPTITAEDTPFQPALLLPEVTALKQAERIVASRGTFQPQRELELRCRGVSRTVRATKLLEQTESFDLFLFS
jgi:hypothetical protein